MAGKVKVDDKVWRELTKELTKIAKKFVKVGILESKGGNDDLGGGITAAGLGAIHEFGTNTIPARSFLRTTFKANRSAFKTLTKKLTAKFLERKMSGINMLGIIGLWGQKEIKNRILSNIAPPLAEATVKGKGSDLALVDTGGLLNSIHFEVTDDDS